MGSNFRKCSGQPLEYYKAGKWIQCFGDTWYRMYCRYFEENAILARRIYLYSFSNGCMEHVHLLPQRLLSQHMLSRHLLSYLTYYLLHLLSPTRVIKLHLLSSTHAIRFTCYPQHLLLPTLAISNTCYHATSAIPNTIYHATYAIPNTCYHATFAISNTYSLSPSAWASQENAVNTEKYVYWSKVQGVEGMD